MAEKDNIAYSAYVNVKLYIAQYSGETSAV